MALYDHEGTRGLAPLSILEQTPRNLPPGGGALYAAQFGGVGFHSSLGDGASASLQQNENSHTMNLAGKTDRTNS